MEAQHVTTRRVRKKKDGGVVPRNKTRFSSRFSLGAASAKQFFSF
jgi:hypothetical protein